MRIYKGNDVFKLYNEVNEEQFKKYYEPKGWRKCEEIVDKKEEVKQLKTEEEIKVYEQVKKKKGKKFNDDLIKG